MKNLSKQEQSKRVCYAECENVSTSCKKYIFVLNAIELINKLMNGKRVEGVLYMDENTGRLTFKAYNRKPQVRYHDRLLHRMEHGWVRESKERIKVYESIPKELGTARVMSILERETKEAKNTLIERELDLIEFC